jgi:hypothetical protein
VGVATIVTFSLMLLFGTVDGTTPKSAKALAAVQLADVEDDFDRQWACLDALWEHESKWDYTAKNPHSSARGIPQALVDLHGLSRSWQSDPQAQIEWGLDYIYGRYGSPCDAWEAWKSRATLLPDGRWHGGWY